MDPAREKHDSLATDDAWAARTFFLVPPANVENLLELDAHHYKGSIFIPAIDSS